MTEETTEYSVHGYMQRRFFALGRKLRFAGSTPEDATAWRAQARKTLVELIGMDTMNRSDAPPRITEEKDCGDHLRQRIEIAVEPGLAMPVYVLIPKGAAPPFPAVIAPHGHNGGGKAAVAGIAGHPQIAVAIKQYNYAYGLDFVRAGCLVLCPDARGFGERQEDIVKGRVLESSCQWINNMAMPLGQTITGMWAWDLMRLVDYAVARPDCDPDRVGCAGLSGGGLQTLWLAALDDRIRAAVVSGYFYGVKQSLLDLYANCSCDYVPHLWEYADHGDLGALVAPRPLLIQTGDMDELNGASGLDNVRPQLEIARNAYRVFAAEDRLVHDVFNGPHRWDGTNAVPFLVRALGKRTS